MLQQYVTSLQVRRLWLYVLDVVATCNTSGCRKDSCTRIRALDPFIADDGMCVYTLSGCMTSSILLLLLYRKSLNVKCNIVQRIGGGGQFVCITQRGLLSIVFRADVVNVCSWSPLLEKEKKKRCVVLKKRVYGASEIRVRAVRKGTPRQWFV